MITKLAIKNFKCLLDVEARLSPFTVLIGPNDSGKSSLLDALHLLGKTTEMPFAQVFSGDLSLDNLVWMRDVKREINWRVTGEASGQKFEYYLALCALDQYVRAETVLYNDDRILEVTPVRPAPQPPHLDFPAAPPQRGKPKNTVQAGYSGLLFASQANLQPFAPPNSLSTVTTAIHSTTKYHLDTEALRRTARLTPKPELDAIGSNLVAVLDAIMSNPDRSAINELEASLRKAIPTIWGVTLPVGQNGTKSLQFSLAGPSKPRKAIPASLASDGAVLITAFLALAYGDTPDLIFIEEPENGLHYTLLGQVIDLLRKISRGEIGNRPRQVIVTTQSPLFLNFVSPEEVLVCQRGEDAGTTVTPMSEVPDLDRLLREFAPGELWYLLGEERLVKGGQP
jgi:predicted ATPase